MFASAEPGRRGVLGLVILVGLGLLAAVASPAAAAKSCGRQVLDDWSDGQLEGNYAARCYSDALAIAPRDLLLYSSLEDDLKRALQAAKRGTPVPPNRDRAGSAPEAPVAETPVEETPTDEPAPDSRTTAGSPPAAPNPPDEPEGRPAPAVATGSATSLPLPLLVLAGLGFLLVTGGSAGYLLRRLRGGPAPP